MKLVLAFLVALVIKFLVGILLPSYLIAHGLFMAGIDVQPAAIGWILIAVWLIFGALLPSYNTKVNTDDK